MKIALVIGHSRKSKGARNSSFEMDEFDFNETLAKQINADFKDYNLNDEIVIVYRENGFVNLPNEINELNANLIVSLHCNAFNTKANGCEMLYYHRSETGKKVAEIFQGNVLKALKNKDRGILSRTSEDRGGYLLKATNAPCIIAEPFFIDNDKEFINAMDNSKELVKAYCNSINESIQYIRTLK